MIKTIFSYMLGITILLISSIGFGEESPLPTFLELNTLQHNSWLISGLLQNEQDEPYGFLFKIERQQYDYHASAVIYDLNNQQILWHKAAFINTNQAIEKIDGFFWHYSPINSSLIIGYQDEKHQIFNLKLDLIEPTVVYKSLNPTADIKIKEFWSGGINGHININHEEFVNSSNAWIQNLSQDDKYTNTHDIHELLCKFQDGQALFALQVPEKNATRAAVTNLFNANGKKQSVSQFINLKLPAAQDYNLKLHQEKNPLHIHAVFAGKDFNILHARDTERETQGYCVYLQNPWAIFESHEVPKQISQKKQTFIEKTIALGKKPFKIPFLLKNKMTS
jgi:hypothetical protein